MITYTAVRRQDTLTLGSEIVQESDFSYTANNSAYVSDVQNLKCLVRYGIYKKTHFGNFAN